MKKEMTLTAPATTAKTNGFIAEKLGNIICRPLQMLRGYYAKVLQTEVTMRQTKLLVNAQLAFVFAVFPSDCPFVVRMLCIAWLIYAIVKCKNSGLRTSD